MMVSNVDLNRRRAFQALLARPFEELTPPSIPTISNTSENAQLHALSQKRNQSPYYR